MKKIELDSKESLNIIEIGCDKATLTKVVNSLSCYQNIYSINPNKRDLDDLEVFFRNNNKVNFKKLNFAVSDVTGKKIFYITKDDSASSIYEPNQKILKRYRSETDTIFDILEKKEIDCEKLDNVCLRENINNIDLLLMFCQASELDILKGSSKILEKISLIHTDLAFIEKYKKQPLYDDFVSYMNKNNFKFVGYTHVRTAEGTSGSNIREIDGTLIEVRALFMNKALKNYNNVENVAKILIHFNFYLEAKWLLQEKNFKEEFYNSLLNLKMKKKVVFFKIISSVIFKISFFKNKYIKKMFIPIISLFKKK